MILRLEGAEPLWPGTDTSRSQERLSRKQDPGCLDKEIQGDASSENIGLPLRGAVAAVEPAAF